MPYKIIVFVALLFAIFTDKKEAPLYLIAAALFEIARLIAV